MILTDERTDRTYSELVAQISEAQSTIQRAAANRMDSCYSLTLSYDTFRPQRRDGLSTYVQRLKKAFPVSDSLSFTAHELSLTIIHEQTEYYRSGEVVFAFPARADSPALAYNIYLPPPIRGFGIGRLLFASGLFVFPDDDSYTQLLGIPASANGKRLIDSFGGTPVSSAKRHNWYRIR